MMPPQVTILPAQAARIAREAAETGAAIGVVQAGNTLILNTGRKEFSISAGGFNLVAEEQEKLC
jgi:hypothetical protein